jgi:hypothetical protein
MKGVPVAAIVQAVQIVVGRRFGGGELTAKGLARHSRNQMGKSFYHEGHEGLENYFSELRALRVLRGEMDFSY